MTAGQQRFLPSLAAAAALHAAVVGWLWLRPAPAREARRPPTVVRLVARAPAAAPAPAPPAREPPRVDPERPRRLAPPRQPERLARAEPPPPPARAAPAAEPPPPGPPPAPRRFAVSMDAVVPGGAGGVAVPTTEGRTAARGDPRLPSSAPVGDNTAWAEADVTEVERAPQVLAQPSAEALRRYYPEEARRQGVEGNVRIELLVGDRGTVERLRIVERGGSGFDEAVLAAADAIRPQFRFRPAERAGRPVAVWIPWTIKFRLDG